MKTTNKKNYTIIEEFSKRTKSSLKKIVIQCINPKIDLKEFESIVGQKAIQSNRNCFVTLRKQKAQNFTKRLIEIDLPYSVNVLFLKNFVRKIENCKDLILNCSISSK